MIRTAIDSLGFDSTKVGYVARTAIASALSLLLAWYLGLEHPQWSAMTVWAASQPLRGHLFEKSLARLAGTAGGAVFGMGLVLVAQGEIWVLVLGMSFWVALCVLVGNVLRGYTSYAAFLSGYTAGMVALLDTSHPAHVVTIGLDRLATVGLGIVAALLVGWLFAARGDDTTPRDRAISLTSRLLVDVADRLRRKAIGEVEPRVVMSEIAALEGILDAHASRSLAARRVARRVRALLAAQVGILLWLRGGDLPDVPSEAIDMLEKVALGLEFDRGEASFNGFVDRLAEGELREVLSAAMSAHAELDTPGADEPANALHVDWSGARKASFRALAAMLTVGGAWMASGWEMGGFMMLGIAIMLSIFSTFENPVSTLRFVFAGQVIGALTALACRFAIWPMASDEFGLVLSMVPIILIGAVLAAHARTQRLAFDCSMVSLLLLQPSWPQASTFVHSAAVALAVVSGPVVAMIAFKLVFPVDSMRRYRAVKAAMMDDLRRFARSASVSERSGWRDLFHHRVLLAAYWGDRAMLSRQLVEEEASGLFSISQAVESLRQIALQSTSDRERRLAKAALLRLARLDHDPIRATRALAASARSHAGTQIGAVLNRATVALGSLG